MQALQITKAWQAALPEHMEILSVKVCFLLLIHFCNRLASQDDFMTDCNPAQHKRSSPHSCGDRVLRAHPRAAFSEQEWEFLPLHLSEQQKPKKPLLHCPPSPSAVCSLGDGKGAPAGGCTAVAGPPMLPELLEAKTKSKRGWKAHGHSVTAVPSISGIKQKVELPALVLPLIADDLVWGLPGRSTQSLPTQKAFEQREGHLNATTVSSPCCRG